MKQQKLWLIIVILVIGSTVNAQNAKQQAKLIELSEKWRINSQIQKEQAVQLATEKGWPIRTVDENGRIIELMSLNENGMPIYYTTYNADGAVLINSDELYAGGAAGLNLSGAGQILGEWDGGDIRTTHVELDGRVIDKDGASIYGIADHPTHVAGTMIASGVDAAAKGMSFAANLDAYDWDDDESEMAAAAAAGLKVSQHSYGVVTGWAYGDWSGNSGWHWFGRTDVNATEDYSWGFYSSEAESWDEISANAPNYLIVKSAGNDRGEGITSGTHYVRNPSNGWAWEASTTERQKDGGPTGFQSVAHSATAKNVMTVGAVDNTTAMSSFSGWGPTDDGRIKPDIVAKGVSVYSSLSNANNNSYASWQGTSMSGPMVSGSIGLLLEHQENLHSGIALSSATMKGLITHTATDLGNAGPDYIYGWGLMNTEAAAEVMTNNSSNGNHIVESNLSDGQTKIYNVEAVGGEPLVVSIIWTDQAGTTPAISLNPPDLMLVNDLDMRIEDAAATVFNPYVLDPANPANIATTGDNTRDNTEQITISTPTAAGVYTITITHKGTLDGGSQNYSLIVTGNTSLSESAATTSLPYAESFDTDLGDCYAYNVSGGTKNWTWSEYGGNGYAKMNGYNSGDTEEDWLILPGINADNSATITMNFETAYKYGTDDANNYLKLFYSTDYDGIGNPNDASWTELFFTKPTTGEYTYANSGNIDLSTISGQFYLGFKYHYESGSYREWQIDNINIISQELITFYFRGPDWMDNNPNNPQIWGPFNSWAGAAEMTYNGELGWWHTTIEVADASAAIEYQSRFCQGGSVKYQKAFENFGLNPTFTTTTAEIWIDASDNGSFSWSGSDFYLALDKVTENEPLTTEPANHVTNIAANADSESQISLSWTDSDAAFYLVKGSSVGYGDITAPLDGTTESDGILVKNVSSTLQSINFSGLEAATTYYFKIFPYNGSGSNINYKTDGAVPEATATTEDAPTEPNFGLRDDGGVNLPTITYWFSGQAGDIIEKGSEFDSKALGELTALYIKGTNIKSWKSGEGNVTGATFSYKIWESTADEPAVYTERAVNWSSDDGGGNQTWANFGAEIEATSGLTPGNYNFKIFFSISGSGFPGTTENGPFTASFTVPEPASSDAEILTFTLAEQTGAAVINSAAATVALEVANGTALTNLTPTITISENATISPASGIAQDFSSPVEYTVTAEDLTEKVWTVTVTEAAPPAALSLPYSNGLRTTTAYNQLLTDGFIVDNADYLTTAGGYLKIFNGGTVETPLIDFTAYGLLQISFSSTTFGGVTGQTVAIEISENSGGSYTQLSSYTLTNSYATYEYLLDLSAYSSETGKLRFKMISGTNSSRFRDLSIAESIPDPEITFANLQWPASGAIEPLADFNVYAQVYIDGQTGSGTATPDLQAWIGYSTDNSNPNTWTNWIEADFQGINGNNDEFFANLGAEMTTEGTFYYASRFKYLDQDYVYGGFDGGFWDGTTNVSGVLTVAEVIETFPVQFTVTDETESYQAIEIKGSMTDWATVAMTESPDFVWTITLDVPAGTYEWGAIENDGSDDGIWLIDGPNPSFAVSETGNITGTVSYTIPAPVDPEITFANLQWPASGAIEPLADFNVYAQVYIDGRTGSGTATPDLQAWIGYSTDDTDPSSWTNWIEADFQGINGNNDEFFANLGAEMTTEGTFYYASRFKYLDQDYVYGGFDGGFWDGTTNVSGVLTVAEVIETFPVQFTVTDETESYQAIEIKGSMTDWATVAMTESPDFVWTITLDVPAGTYEWGAIENDGSDDGIWLIDGPNPSFTVSETGDVTGTVSYTIPVASDPEIAFANLQWPASGTIEPLDDFNVYAQAYIAGETGSGTATADLQAWIGYSTDDTDPATWTNWIEADFQGINGNNDEFFANLGAEMTTEGTFYYASRFKYLDQEYVYGGFDGGFWDGVDNVSGVLTVAEVIETYPVEFTVTDGTESYLAIEIKGSMTDWATVPMTEGPDFVWTITLDIPAGTYEWGAIENDGSDDGIWLIDGPNPSFTVSETGDVTGTVSYTIPAPADPVIGFANLQHPASGTIEPLDDFNVYAQAYIEGETGSGTATADLQAWIGYSTDDTDPATWTNWIEADFQGINGNNDEFFANLGAEMTTEGTFYYASRFKYLDQEYVYGGFDGGFWDGVDNVSGVLTVAEVIETYPVEFTVTDGTESYLAIEIKGSMTDWATVPMTEGPDFVWTITLDIPAGTYEWGAIENDGSDDGIWLIDGPNPSFTVSETGDVTGTVSYTIPVASDPEIAFANLQWPASGTIEPLDDFNVYAQAYIAGETGSGTATTDLQAWIGYSTDDTDPATWTNWIEADFSSAQGNNDEFFANLGAEMTTEGTFYYASRFKYLDQEYVYGGFDGGFWDGVDNVSGVLNVTTAPPDPEITFANLQFPASASILIGESFEVYAQVEASGVPLDENGYDGMTVWIGYSSDDTDPASWTNWFEADYNGISGFTNRPEYLGEIGSDISAAGTYYYASRFQLSGGDFVYGGFDGGFWDGVDNVSGVLTVTEEAVDPVIGWANLQWPPAGLIEPSEEFMVYAQAWIENTTGSGTATAGLQSWIGYSTDNTDPATWTNWIEADFNDAVGSNDEFMANLGAELSAEGTYYYASRFQYLDQDYVYGGFSEAGGGFWDGVDYVSGQVVVVNEVVLYPITFTATDATGLYSNIKFKGEMTNWETVPMEQNGEEWTLSFDILPGTYEWGLIEDDGSPDGIWLIEGPNLEVSISAEGEITGDTTYVITYVGLEEQQAELKLYPNPAKSRLYLEFSHTGDYEVQLLDTKGQLLNRLKSADTRLMLPVQTLESGAYLIRIISDNNIVTKKFIKQ